MAVPTFTSVTPAEGHPGGGQVVEIVGTNFRTRALVYEVPQADAAIPVAVTFGGQSAEYVEVVSDTLLRVAVPQAVLDPNTAASIDDPSVSRVTFPAVDIVINNVDDDGSSIGGETVTAAGAYTYRQPLIYAPEGDSPLLQVLRRFLWQLRRCSISDVAKSTHTDYGEAGETITALAEHPSIGLQLSWPRDVEYAHYDNEKRLVQTAPGVWAEYDIQRTVMLLAEMTVSAKNEAVLLQLMSSIIDMQLAAPRLRVPRDSDWPEAGADNLYPLEWVRDFAGVDGMSRTNVKAYTAQMRVRGIPIVRGDPSRTVRQIASIFLTDTRMQDGSPQTVEV